MLQSFGLVFAVCGSNVLLHYRPVILEVPHFASLRGREREITILRSDNGQTWREHDVVATEEAVNDALGGTFDGNSKI